MRIQRAADGSLVVDSGPVERLTPSGRTFDKRSRQSEGEKFTTKKLDQYKKLARTKDKNKANEIIGTATEITNENRAAQQKAVQDSIEKYGLNENTFNAARFNNSGAVRTRLDNGDVVYDLTNGETIKGVPVMETVDGRRRQKRGKPNKKYPKGPKLFTQPTLKQIQNLHGEGVTLVAARNRLYYGVNDPAYQTAIKAARKNNKDGQKSFKRVSVINDF